MIAPNCSILMRLSTFPFFSFLFFFSNLKAIPNMIQFKTFLKLYYFTFQLHVKIHVRLLWNVLVRGAEAYIHIIKFPDEINKCKYFLSECWIETITKIESSKNLQENLLRVAKWEIKKENRKNIEVKMRWDERNSLSSLEFTVC